MSKESEKKYKIQKMEKKQKGLLKNRCLCENKILKSLNSKKENYYVEGMKKVSVFMGNQLSDLQ